MKTTRRDFLKAGVLATTASLLPVNLFAQTAFKHPNTPGLARKCLILDKLKTGALARYERSKGVKSAVYSPRGIVDSLISDFADEEVWIGFPYKYNNSDVLQQEDDMFMDLLIALKKKSKNIHRLHSKDLTVEDCNGLFGILECNELIVDNIVVNSNTFEVLNTFPSHVCGESGSLDRISSHDDKFLWTANVYINNRLKNNEVVALVSKEYVGVITQCGNRMGMGIINDYSVAFMEPNGFKWWR